MHVQLKFGIEAILAPSFCSSSGSSSSSPNCSDVSSGSLNTSPVATAPPVVPTPLPSLDNRALFPAWVFCTRYSDRPSSGQRTRKPRKRENSTDEEKRPRTAFTADQLGRLKEEFRDNRYLTEKRRQQLAHELRLNESQIKIWFQNKRAKLKKTSGERPPIAFTPFVAHSLYHRVLQQ